MNVDGSLTISDAYRGKTNGRQGQPFKRLPLIGFMVIQIARELHGKQWDDLALAYLHAFRPSHIRVVDDYSVQLDSQPWRITVYLKDGLIERIDQEVEVGVLDHMENGTFLKRDLFG